MTLQAGDKLMSPRTSRKCWAFLFTPCTAGATRATVRPATEWAVTCGTVERLSRLGWNSRSTNASKRGASISPRAARKASTDR